MGIKRIACSSVVIFVLLFFTVSAFAKDDYTPMSKEKFEGGLKVLKDNGYILLAYYTPPDSSEEIKTKITDYKTMVDIVNMQVEFRIVALEIETGKEIEIEKMEGNGSKSLTEDCFKKICSALGVYAGCKEFFGWK